MKKARIEIDPIAERDMIKCVDYIATHLRNPIAANAMLDHIDAMYDRLEINPLMGTEYITPSNQIYRWVLVGNYRMFYTVNHGTVRIRRFLYAPSDIAYQID